MAVQGYEHQSPWDTGFLPVGSIHKIHYEQYGKQDGKPVVYLHGGPGGGTSPASTVFFDPSVYRVVLFDQRGAGKSIPSADLRENTPQHLVSDIDALRQHLRIDKWHVVFGGSWGSTLALFYAQAHPQAVGSLVLRGVFTVRHSELQFSRSANGAAQIFPEAYEEFINFLPPEDRSHPYSAYHRLLTSGDQATQLRAARAWNRWELSIGELVPGDDTYAKLDDDTWSLQHARMEIHYESNNFFVEEGHFYKEENLAKIRHIPCSIVQGRYDVCCPARSAWDLHKVLPESKLYIIPDAGHSAMEPGTKKKLIEVCDDYASLL